MIKARDRNGDASVTFTLPAAVGAGHVAICGEWNDWAADRDIMERAADGFSLAIRLEPGRSYRFRYLLDGTRWENDWAADAYVPNGYGSDDSVVDLTDLPDIADLPGTADLPDTDAGPSPEAGPVVEPEEDRRPLDGNVAVEREAKLLAPDALELPDLSALAPGSTAAVLPVMRLDATYYDTADLRLARSGITLRHRGGEPGPAWTVKFPKDSQGSDLVRTEIRLEGPVDQIPRTARDLVLATARTGTLEPVARLTTVRRPVDIRGGDGDLLAEVVDDIVVIAHNGLPAGRFREVEVELRAPDEDGRLLAAAVSRLVEAGCTEEAPVPKLVRALGEHATGPPDVVVPTLAPRPTAAEVVRHAIARSVAQIIRHDPGARLGTDPESVHKLRVAARRLRSDLHSFSPLLDKQQLAPVRAELSWLGGVVGAVRDTDVLGARLRELHDVDTPGFDMLMSRLACEAAGARDAMLEALRDPRYLGLLDTLVDLAAAPPFVKPRPFTGRSPTKIAAKIARKPWRRLVDAVDALDPHPSDTDLHKIRILAKRCRYAAEAVAPLAGPKAASFAGAVADLQTVLGDHQDTVVAELWLRSVVPASPAERTAAEELIAAEQRWRIEFRSKWPAVWQAASSKPLRSWF